jgi:hypothetical protein
MKRIAFVSSLAAVGLFSAVGFADTFTINEDAGTQNVSSARVASEACVGDAELDVELQLVEGYTSSANDWTLNRIIVRGIPADCIGNDMTAVVTDADNNVLNQQRTERINGTTKTFGQFGFQQIPVEDIAQTAILIQGKPVAAS